MLFHKILAYLGKSLKRIPLPRTLCLEKNCQKSSICITALLSEMPDQQLPN